VGGRGAGEHENRQAGTTEANRGSNPPLAPKRRGTQQRKMIINSCLLPFD